MVAICLQVVVGLLSLAALWYKQYLQGAESRQEEARNEETNQGRQDIAAGNTDVVSARIDSVRRETAGDTAVLGDDEDTARRLAKITGK